MPQDDPFAAFGGAAASSTPAPTQPTPQVPSSDPFAAFGGASSSSGVSSPVESATAAPAANDPFAAFGGSSVTPTNPVHSPDNSEQQPPPNEGLMAKIWREANQPLSESVLGIPESRPGAGGLERGAEKVLSGFTSPLSLLLTIGTFGTAGFLESAGANVLKSTLVAGGLDAAAATEKVDQFAQAAKAATEAFNTTGKPVSQAVEATGMPYNEFRSLQSMLYRSGLKEGDLTSGNLVQRGLSTAFRNLGVDAVKAQKIAKGTEFLMNTGFTAQQVDTAVHTAPKVFDLLKEGKYDDAAEYMVEGGVSGALGLIGASHALHSAGETFGSVNEGSNLRPSDENQKANSLLGKREGAIQEGNQSAQNWEEAMRKEMGAKDGIGSVFATKADKENYDNLARKLLVAIDTGNDPEHARQAGNALADAIGQPERKLDAPKREGFTTLYRGETSPGSGKTIPDWIKENPDFQKNLEAEGRWFTNDPEEAKKYAEDSGNGRIVQIEVPNGELDKYRAANDPEAAKFVHHTKQGTLNDEFFVPRELASTSKPADVATHPALPQNIAELVQNAKLSDAQKGSVSKFVDAYHAVANGLTDKEQELFNKLRDRDLTNWQQGSDNGLIHSFVENHIHHIWGPDEDEVGNPLRQEARNGRLDTNVVQARRRLFNTYIEGLLKGKNISEEGQDPVSIIGHDWTGINRAAQNRQVVDFLRDQYVRASDGRPMVALEGEGHVVPGADGENAAAMVNPYRLRDLGIADNAVQQLKATGDLDRFINRGDIVDITKRVTPSNIDDFIDMFERHGMSQEAKYDPEGNNVLRQNIALLKGVKDGTLPASELDKINQNIKPKYVWHPQDYISPNTHALDGWNWISKTDDGTNVLVKSGVRFHPEIAKYLINRLGLDESPLRKNEGIGKLTGPVLKGGGYAKKVLLSFSLFHLQQEALRAIMMGVNPFKMDPVGEFKVRPIIRKVADAGGTFTTDRKALQDHSEGLAEHLPIISKIPIVGPFFDWYQHFLFNRYIPSMKAQAAEVMFDKYQKSHPDWDENAVAKATAQHVNNAFGGQNWRAMGRAAATQDWFHLLALAPDWLESEMRFAASTVRGGLGGKNFSQQQVAKMAMGLWGVARVANLLNTGNMHLEAPFGLATKDKDGREVVYSIRTLPTDILHMATEPGAFLKGRLSPFARLSQEYISGRDQFDRKLQPGDMWVDIARNMAPIPLQALGQIYAGESGAVGNKGQILKSGGFTATPYRTQAEKLAANLASENSESGPMDPQKLRRHEALVKFEDDIRSGHMTIQQLANERDFGDLNQTEYKQIKENLKLTAGQDPTTARMISHASRLSVADALKVWDEATPQEKQALTPVLKKKQQDYMRKAYKDMTPQQRLNDNLFRRLRIMNLEQPTETEQ